MDTARRGAFLLYGMGAALIAGVVLLKVYRGATI